MHACFYSLVEGDYLHVSDGFKGLQELSGDNLYGVGELVFKRWTWRGTDFNKN